jgi:hypothetical protein
LLLARALLAAQRRLWVLAYAAALAVTLVPAGLLEPRYFTPGLMVGLLHAWAPLRGGGSAGDGWVLPRIDAAALAATAAAYVAVNAGVLYLFLARPFAWADGSVARFMW